MPWEPGQSGNPKGKDTGTLSKNTIALRNFFVAFSYNNSKKMQKAFDYILENDPAEGLKLWLQFSERVIGKVSTSSIDLTSNGKELKAPIIYAIGDPPAGDQV